MLELRTLVLYFMLLPIILLARVINDVSATPLTYVATGTMPVGGFGSNRPFAGEAAAGTWI